MRRLSLLVLFLAFTLNAQQKRTLTPEDPELWQPSHPADSF
jgi:hypothetical protein